MQGRVAGVCAGAEHGCAELGPDLQGPGLPPSPALDVLRCHVPKLLWQPSILALVIPKDLPYCRHACRPPPRLAPPGRERGLGE